MQFRSLAFSTALLGAMLSTVATPLQAKQDLVDMVPLTVPVATAVAAPASVLSNGQKLKMVSVSSPSIGTIWYMQRDDDGATARVELKADVAAETVVMAGTMLAVTAVTSGVMLSTAGVAVAFIPQMLIDALPQYEHLVQECIH